MVIASNKPGNTNREAESTMTNSTPQSWFNDTTGEIVPAASLTEWLNSHGYTAVTREDGKISVTAGGNPNHQGDPGVFELRDDPHAVPLYTTTTRDKTTDCAGPCCYNAVKDQCAEPDCGCHKTDTVTAEDRAANRAQRTLEDLLSQFFGPENTRNTPLGILYGQSPVDDGVSLNRRDLMGLFWLLSAFDHAHLATRAAASGNMDIVRECYAEAKRSTLEMNKGLGGSDAAHIWRMDIAARLGKLAELLGEGRSIHVNPF